MGFLLFFVLLESDELKKMRLTPKQGGGSLCSTTRLNIPPSPAACGAASAQEYFLPLQKAHKMPNWVFPYRPLEVAVWGAVDLQ